MIGILWALFFGKPRKNQPVPHCEPWQIGAPLEYTDPRWRPAPNPACGTVRDVLLKTTEGSVSLATVENYFGAVAYPLDPRDHVRRLLYNAVLSILDTPVEPRANEKRGAW